MLYHPNFYNYAFYNKNIFDGYLAWKDTFKVLDDDSSKILDLSCHNFAPTYFSIDEKKIYDFVGLSKLQTNIGNPKNVIEFLKVIKEAMVLKKDLNGIFIISVPGLRPFKTNYIRSIYDKMFTDQEKKKFEFVTLDYDTPFSLSVKTLSIFYNNSKVHLNTHPKERHGRAQTYALSCGLPIVGFSNLTYLVEDKFRKEPYYFISENLEKMSKKLIEAIEYVDRDYDKSKHEILGKNFRSKNSYELLKNKLIDKFGLDNKNWCFIDDWDIRLAKHHLGYQSKNSYNQKITEFLSRLNSLEKDKFINEDWDDQKFIEKKGYFFKKMRFFNYQLAFNLEKLIIRFKNLARSLINIFK